MSLTYDGEEDGVSLPGAGHIGGHTPVPASVRPPHGRQPEVPPTTTAQRLTILDPARADTREVKL